MGLYCLFEDFTAQNSRIEITKKIEELTEKIELRKAKISDLEKSLKEKQSNLGKIKGKISSSYSQVKSKNDDSIKRTEKGLPSEELYSLLKELGVEGEDAKNAIAAMNDEAIIQKLTKNITKLKDDIKKLENEVHSKNQELSKLKNSSVNESISEVEPFSEWKKTDHNLHLTGIRDGKFHGYDIEFIDDDGRERSFAMDFGYRSIRPLKIQVKTEKGKLYYRYYQKYNEYTNSSTYRFM